MESGHPLDQAVEFPSRSSAKIIRKKYIKNKEKKEINEKKDEKNKEWLYKNNK